MIRVASYLNMTPDQLSGAVTQLTSQGIVVEFTDYTNSTGQDWGGAAGVVFTGAELAAESAWYAAMAAYYANNPYVWFGTDNEPATNGGNISQWQAATYNAIRGAGNNSIILIDPPGWDPGSLQQAQTPSVFAGMTNIVWDPHVYSNSGQPTTDAASDAAFVQGMITASQSIQSADGKMPAIIGEYGVGAGPNPTQMVEAVINASSSGEDSGASAWAWDTSPPTLLTNSDGSLTQFGQMVALYIGTDRVQLTPCQQNQRAQIAANAATATATNGQ